jgi:hypothetical protein
METDGPKLKAVFEDLDAAGADIVFMDVCGFASRSLLQGIAKTDLWLLPTRITPGAINGTREALNIAGELRQKGINFTLRLVLN